MTVRERWLLPDGIEEVLPPDAERLEQLRRRILDLFRGWGYELVMPPFIEYVESLLAGMSHDLDLQTFKLIDQLTGRMMGVRADMTPQAARIDAHRLQREVPTRLCYLGTVLHARPGRLDGTRSPLQVGAELYGHGGIASDVEIMRLMLETLALAGVGPVTLDLGHMGIFRGLAKQAGLGEERENELFNLLQRKAVADLASQLRAWKVPPSVRDMVNALTELDGDISVLATARRRLRAAPGPVHDALDALKAIVSGLASEARGFSVHIDLAELRGYHYHTGVMFAAYQPGRGQALALGGRYDSLGAVFGRGRPATGFSADLRHLMQFAARDDRQPSRILAPASDNARLRAAIARLRKRGETVVALLPGQRANAAAMGCDRCLALINGSWKVVKAD